MNLFLYHFYFFYKTNLNIGKIFNHIHFPYLLFSINQTTLNYDKVFGTMTFISPYAQ